MIDYGRDFYDVEHLNAYGSEKATCILEQYLIAERNEIIKEPNDQKWLESAQKVEQDLSEARKTIDSALD